MVGFVGVGVGVNLRSASERRNVCAVRRRRSVVVPRAVVEPEKKTEEKTETVEAPKEVDVVIPKRTTFVGVVYDRLLDTGGDVAQHFARYMRKPEDMKNVKRPRVVILGSGWGAHSLAKVIDPFKYDVVIVSPRNYFLFTPMLPSSAVGTIEFRSIVEPIRKANEFIDYYEGACNKVNSVDQIITCESVQRVDGSTQTFELAYDFLVLGVGATTNTFGIPGVAENCNFLKEISDARALRFKVVELFERANLPTTSDEEKKRLLHFVVVGGGPTGCEYAAELHDLVSQDMAKKYSRMMKHVVVSLLQRQSSILTQFDSALQQRAMDNFRSNGINIVTGASVIEVGSTYISLKDGRKIPYGLALWAAGNGTQPLVSSLINNIPEQEGARGRIITDDWMRVKGIDNVFALGDCAAMESGALPATAQVAGQQGAYLGRLLNRDYCLDCDIPYATKKPNSDVDTIGLNALAKPFQFLSLGIMTYIGEEQSMIQFEAGDQKVKLSGPLTYLLWQSVYATKQVSFRSRVLVLFDWVKTRVFGRDLSQF